MLRETILVFAALAVVLVSATQVNHCGSDEPYESDDTVQITDCDKPTCRLKRKTLITIQQKFKAPADISSTRTSVRAHIAGLPLPFIGVDNVDACKDIYESDGTTKAGCPLKKDNEYVYRNQFPILEIYPRLSMTVHYALVDGAGNTVTCFEVPAQIVS